MPPRMPPTPQQSKIPDEIPRQFPSDSDTSPKYIAGYAAYLNEIEKASQNRITKTSIAQDRISLTLDAFVNVWQVQRQIIVEDEYAIKIAADVSKISKIKSSSPVVNRTRAQIKTRHLEQAVTPTPAPKLKAYLSQSRQRIYLFRAKEDWKPSRRTRTIPSQDPGGFGL